MRCLGVGMHTDPGNCDQRVHLQVAEILKDSKTDDVTVLDVRPRQCDFTDEMVIATARSKLHCQSAAQAVVYRARLFPLTRLSCLQAE
jgi:ribosomal silencing factor RsfS